MLVADPALRTTVTERTEKIRTKKKTSSQRSRGDFPVPCISPIFPQLWSKPLSGPKCYATAESGNRWGNALLTDCLRTQWRLVVFEVFFFSSFPQKVAPRDSRTPSGSRFASRGPLWKVGRPKDSRKNCLAEIWFRRGQKGATSSQRSSPCAGAIGNLRGHVRFDIMRTWLTTNWTCLLFASLCFLSE